ncbi:MAG: LysR family transcriptional regulator [Gammaproteobacteria bacterium]|nr:LysR family transcriptional regulator [Gammaproteobacteria bacterium]
MITFKQLSYALAVEKTRHFKQAAAECAISQSALSTAIAELESQVGLQLFERDNKRVLVTPVGEQFLARAREIKILLDDLYRFSAAERAPLSSPLGLGVIPTIGPYLLPRVLPAVRRQYPDLQLRIQEDQSHVLVEKVRSGELDTAVLALPYDLAGLHAFEFWQEDFYLVTYPGSHLAAHKQVSSEMLRDEPLLLLQDGHCLKDHALAACKFQPAEVTRSVSGTSLYTLLQMVAGGLGSTFVPEMAVAQLTGGSQEYRLAQLTEPGPHRRLALISRLNYAGADNLLLLGKLFRAQLSGA